MRSILFTRSSNLLIELNSQYVVRIYDIHLKGEIKFIDMEYIDGGDLVDLLLSYPDRKVPEEKVIELAEQIARGMKEIHDKRIIHKDLKPQNIMISSSGSIKIMDFGISETFRSSKSRLKETSKSGTPVYMSPEHLMGQDVGRESDIWSFGVMIFELLTGKQLYTGQSYSDVLMQIERKKFESITGANNKLNSLIKKCLQYDYKERFRNFDEILDFLHNKEELEDKTEPKPIVKLKKEKTKTFDSKVNIESRQIPVDKQKQKSKSKALLIVFVLIVLAVSGYFIQNTLQNRKDERIKLAQIEQDKKLKVAELTDSASNYLEGDKLSEAQIKYESIHQIDSGNEIAKQGLKKIEIRRKELEKIASDKKEKEKLKKVEKINKEINHIEKEYQIKLNDYWQNIDSIWELIFSRTLDKKKTVDKTDIPEIVNITRINCSGTAIKKP